MIVLDASVLIAHLGTGDEHADAAFEILDGEEELTIHPLTLAEVLVGAVRQGNEIVVHELIEAIGIVPAAAAHVESLFLARLRAEERLRMPDCCVLGLALAKRAAIATFDLRLAEAARRRGIEVRGA